MRSGFSSARDGFIFLLIPYPGNASRDARAHTTNAKENTKVFGTSGDVRELNNIADYANEHAANDEDATLKYPIRPPSDG